MLQIFRIFFVCVLLCIVQVMQGQEYQRIQLLSQLDYENRLSDVWGYATIKGEYALVGVYNGISIVDVTQAQSPREIAFLPGEESIWRDLKTWGHYLYVVNETGGGLQIIDLSKVIEGDLFSSYIENTDLGFETAHNIYIDEQGVLYIFGFDNDGGFLMYDIASDPENPILLGSFSDYYLHDGMARGDTLWAAAINEGLFSVIDVSNKASPEIMASHETPNYYTHNCWVSNNGDYLFTTDEVGGAYVVAYDVSDLNNIEEVDRIQAWGPESNVVPHNTHVFGNFLFTSYYADGLSVVDVTHPDNMVEVAYYDTSPDYSGDGFHGAWGAYPWLPSGNILVTDIEMGLYVFSSNHIRASYIEGQVIDAVLGTPLSDVNIQFLATNHSDRSNAEGFYKTGFAEEGMHEITYQAIGYEPLVKQVELSKGEILRLDAELIPYTACHFYPNPSVSGYVSIYAPDQTNFSVYSVKGEFLYNKVFDKGLHSIDLTHLVSGVYFFNFTTESDDYTRLWVR